MIRLSGQLICATAEEMAIVLVHLHDHLRLTRAEPGCLSFDVTRTADPMVWQVEECFASRAAFDAHQARSRASVWSAQTVHMRRSYRLTES